ncbi:MAG: hypothetical protein H7336_05495 [Bacteriovorax sp.]|nr:hypothetical protein [Bacteriovorax sp.]
MKTAKTTENIKKIEFRMKQTNWKQLKEFALKDDCSLQFLLNDILDNYLQTKNSTDMCKAN